MILGIKDPYVMPIYLTLLPFHALLLFLSVKSKNVLFIFYSAFLFLSHGIGSTLFYLNRDRAEAVGFSAIGNFDFSYYRMFKAYSYLFVFILALTLFVYIFKRKDHTNFLPEHIKQQYNNITIKSSNWSQLPILTGIVIFSAISIWMYNKHIGMIGLHQTELPFHLTGVLFYSRRFLFPIILLWFFIKTKNKETASFLLAIFSFIVGVTSTSKSASLLILVPLAYINYLIGKKKLFVFLIILIGIIYYIVGEMRTLIYEYDADIDLVSVITFSFDFSNDKNLLITILGNITGRLYGLQSTVLADQYWSLSFNDLLRFYTTSTISEIVPNMAKTLFGFSLPDDKAFGVGIGFNGTMQLLSCHNYYYSIIQAFIVSILFSIQNNCVQRIMKTKGRMILKNGIILLLLFSFIRFYNGFELLSIYISILIILISRYKIFGNVESFSDVKKEIN